MSAFLRILATSLPSNLMQKHNSTKEPQLAMAMTNASSSLTPSGSESHTDLGLRAVFGLLLLLASTWAYWPTLSTMVSTWSSEPDYSHGFLVLPIAIFFAYTRRSSLPFKTIRYSQFGIVLLSVAIVGRYIAGEYYLETIDGWTIPVWLSGAVCLVYGLNVTRWCLPSIVFLWFMVPLPYGAERWLSLPLQSIATSTSAAALRMLNLPAITEGNTILIGQHVLEIERACAGLRIVVGISALTFAFVLFSQSPWWHKALALLATLPIAIAANTVRIVVTGILMTKFSGEAARHFGHNIAGWIMIPFAAALLWCFLTYIERLFPLVQEIRPALPSSSGR